MKPRLDDLLTPAALVGRYPDLCSMSQVRYWIHKEHHNGLADSGAIIRKGRRLWINVPRFRDWLCGLPYQASDVETVATPPTAIHPENLSHSLRNSGIKKPGTAEAEPGQVSHSHGVNAE
jgi:hypothetical protein